MRQFFALFLILFYCHTVHALPTKEWSLLIYVNGNNDLDKESKQSILKIEKVGSTQNINVAVQWASLSARRTVRFLAQKSINPNQVTSPILEDLGIVDMGDVHTLRDFLHWGVKNFPARHYLVVIWDHGSGWHTFTKTAKQLNVHTMDISHDYLSHHAITIEQLGAVMGDMATLIGHKIDIFASDACLMAMVEVANEMADSVNYFIGSQAPEPSDSMPYHELLAEWNTQPNATPKQVAKMVVSAFIDYYQKHLQFVTLSAFDLSKIKNFDRAVTTLGKNLRELGPTDRHKVIEAAARSQNFNGDYLDALDFLKRLLYSNIRGLPLQALQNFQDTAQAFIIANVTLGYEAPTGMSIWFPLDLMKFTYLDRYKALKFNQETQWADTLTALLL